MIDPLSRVGVMDWALIAFRAVASFPLVGPPTVLSIDPLPDQTRGAAFVGFTFPDPNTMIVSYELDSPLEENERVEIGGAKLEDLVPGDIGDPIFPLALSKRPSPPDNRFFEAVVITNGKMHPPGSPDVKMDFYYDLGRAIPV